MRLRKVGLMATKSSIASDSRPATSPMSALRPMLVRGWLLAIVLATAAPCWAQFDPAGIEPVTSLRGTLFLHGGGGLNREVRSRFIELAGGAHAKLVVITCEDPDNPAGDEHLSIWTESGAASVERLHAESRDGAMREEFCMPLKAATAVWISGGPQSRLAETYVGTPVERALRELIGRGGVVGGTSAGAAVASQAMLVRGDVRTGMGLLPGTMIDPHFLVGGRQEQLMKSVEAAHDRVGLGIDEHTTLLVRGRRIEVLGDSVVTICLPSSPRRPASQRELKSGATADLVALCRSAQVRAANRFPPEKPAEPLVKAGTLVIVGGGELPRGILRQFIEFAGGEDAPLVYVPCEEQEFLPEEPRFVEALRKAGAKQVAWIHTKERRRANEDHDFLAPLKQAKGIWFGGGRQWNLVDSYHNTTAHRLMEEVLSRGGAIGGSSAGASIQGEYMPRGDPLGNLNIIAEGYEQGLGFLRGVAIDQHFSQRNRFADMTQLMRTYPQFLGIGIDEGTAVVVREKIATVVGRGNAAFYDPRRESPPESPDYIALKAGQAYDLVQRTVVETPDPKTPDPKNSEPKNTEPKNTKP